MRLDNILWVLLFWRGVDDLTYNDFAINQANRITVQYCT